MSKQTEIAWAAGFWDGEGCTSLERNSRGAYPRMTVAQVDFRSIWRFQAAVGNVGHVRNKKSQLPGKWSPQIVWSCSKEADVLQVCSLLWPYLGDVKREQIIKCRKEAEARRPAINRNRDKKECKRGHPLSGPNLIVRHPLRGPNAGRTLRECRECQNALSRRRKRQALSDAGPGLFEVLSEVS
ncbi:MAG: hypothetical protein M0027_19325 [Candidatus Dormibacteraeota bacterium]|nr:hypothetical protein [Candidatus Dormibacteraeota bacterium]